MAEYELSGDVTFSMGHLDDAPTLTASPEDGSGLRTVPMAVAVDAIVLVDGTPRSGETVELELHVADGSPAPYRIRLREPLADGVLSFRCNFDLVVGPDGGEHTIELLVGGQRAVLHPVHIGPTG